MLTIKQSRELAVEYHVTWKNGKKVPQTDKLGRNYLMHLDEVRKGVQVLGGDRQVQAAAYLHDIVEDTAMTLTKLADLGASPRQVKMVKAVTKMSGAVQAHYLDGIVEAGTDAMMLKLADLLSNTRPDKMALLPEATRNRLRKKYTPSIARLMSELGYIVTHDQLAAIPQGSYGSYSSDSYEWKLRNVSWIIKGDEVKIVVDGKETVGVVKDKVLQGKNATFTFEGGITMTVPADRQLTSRMVKKTYSSGSYYGTSLPSSTTTTPAKKDEEGWGNVTDLDGLDDWEKQWNMGYM